MKKSKIKISDLSVSKKTGKQVKGGAGAQILQTGTIKTLQGNLTAIALAEVGIAAAEPNTFATRPK